MNLKKTRKDGKKKNKRKKTAKGKRTATVYINHEEIKYEKISFSELLKKYENNTSDERIYVEIKRDDEGQRQSIDNGKILTIHSNISAADYFGDYLRANIEDIPHTIRLEKNDGNIETIIYNNDGRIMYNFKIGMPTGNIVKTKISKSSPVTPPQKRSKHVYMMNY